MNKTKMLLQMVIASTNQAKKVWFEGNKIKIKNGKIIGKDFSIRNGETLKSYHVSEFLVDLSHPTRKNYTRYKELFDSIMEGVIHVADEERKLIENKLSEYSKEYQTLEQEKFEEFMKDYTNL